jgi:hypothetical protein
MSQHDELFVLVKSLTKFEKGYVKKRLNASATREGAQLSQLLDAIGQQETYDESSLKGNFSKGRSKSHFAVIKRNLFRRTLLALSSYHGKKSRYAELFDHLRCAEMLHQRGRQQAALDLLKDVAQGLCEDGQREEEILLVARLRNRILALGRNYFTSLEPRLEEINQVQEALRILTSNHHYWQLYSQVEHLNTNTGLRSSSELRETMLEWLQNPLLVEESQAQSLTAQILRLESLIRLHYGLMQMDQVEIHARSLIERLEMLGPELEVEWTRHLFAVSFIMGVHIQQYRYVESLEWQEKGYRILELGAVSDVQRARYSRGLFNAELQCYCRLGMVSDLRRRLAQTTTPEGLMPAFMQDSSRWILYPNLIWAHMLVGDVKRAMTCFRELHDQPYQDWMFDILQKSRVIAFCCLASQGDTEQLHRMTEAYRKFICSRKQLNDYDKVLIRFFKGYMPNDRRRHGDFSRELLKLENERKGDEVVGIQFFPVYLWANAIELGLSFAEVSARCHGTVQEPYLSRLRQLPVPMFTSVPIGKY